MLIMDLYIQSKFEFTVFVVVYVSVGQNCSRTHFVRYAIFVWEAIYPEHYVIDHFYYEWVWIYLQRQFLCD